MDGANGTAIIAGYGLTNVTNNGTITGSINLNQAPGASFAATGNINNSGTLNTGATVVTSMLTNGGTVNTLGLSTIGTTALVGQFSQSGTLQIDINSLATQQVDLLNVSGAATVGGHIEPIAAALLPGSLTVLSAGSLNTTASAQSSLVFNWSATQSGNTLVITPADNFIPQGISLTPSENALASHLGASWSNADRSFAPLFGYLSQVGTSSQYTRVLDTLSAKATQVQSLALANSSGAILGSSMSCPVFVNQSVLLREDNCVWVKVSGQRTNQWQSGDTQGYQVASTGYRIGGQHEIAPTWYLGGSIAAGQTWASANGGSSGYGQTFDGSVALKHTMGPWMIGGSVALASGAFHSNRVVSLPGVGTLPGVYSVQKGNPSIFLAGARLRGAYEFTFTDWYVRPYGDLDVVYSNTPGFQESGSAGYALNVRGGSKTSVVLSQMVEIGGRITLDERTTLRPFVAVGVSFLPNNTRFVDASFVGALPSNGTFRSYAKSPGVLGSFDLGLQLYRDGMFEVKAEYGLKVGGSFISQTGSARVAYHF